MKTEVRDEAKTDKIIASARKLFLQNGFEKTTMEEIARDIPMSKATLYAVFPNKEEILLLLCETHCANLQRMSRAVLDQTSSDYLSALKQILTQLVTSVYEESSKVRTPEMLMYVSDRVKGRCLDQFEGMKAVIRDLLNRAIEEDEIAKDSDSGLLCEVIMAMLTSYFPPYQRNFKPPQVDRPDRKTFDTEVETLLTVLIAGLKKYKRD